MSLANAFASGRGKRRKNPAAGLALNPQAAAQTMFSASARQDDGLGAMSMSMSLGDQSNRRDEDEELFGNFIAGDDDTDTASGRINGKRKGRDGDELMGIDGGDGSSSKRTKSGFDDGEHGHDGTEGLGGLGSLNETFGLTDHDRSDHHSGTGPSSNQHHSLGMSGMGDFDIPLDDMGTYGSSIDAFELQRFLQSTATSPAAPSAPALPVVDDEPDVLPTEPPTRVQSRVPSPAPPVSLAPDSAISTSLPPLDPSPLPDLANLPDLPNLANLPDLPDLQVSSAPSDQPHRATYGNYSAIDPALQPLANGGDDGSQTDDERRAPSQDQVEMIRQIFNINSTDDFNIMGLDTSESSPAPPQHSSYNLATSLADHAIDPSLGGSIPVDSAYHSITAIPPPPPTKPKKSKKKKDKKKDNHQEHEVLVDPPPLPMIPTTLPMSLSPAAGASPSQSGSVEPVASGSKPKSSKKSSKSSGKAKNPILRVVNDRPPTPRNPNGSAPGASDFAPPDGGLTAREAASLFNGDEDHAHPCPHVNCDKAFTRKSDFLRHYRIHTGERPFVCSHAGCGKSFIQRSALTVHERVHSGEKPHTCEDCQRQFSDSSSLARHRRIHQGLKPFKCEMCGTKSFSRRATLTRHQNICPGRTEGYISHSTTPQAAPSIGETDPSLVTRPKTKSKSKKSKSAKTHPSVKLPDGGIPPPGHPLYNVSASIAGSMSSATNSPEPDLEVSIGGSMEPEDDEDEDDEEDNEHEGSSHDVRVNDAVLPPIPVSIAPSFRPSPASNYLNLPGSPASSIPSVSPRLTSHRRLSNGALPPPHSPQDLTSSTSATRTEVQPVPRPSTSRRTSPSAATTKKSKKERERERKAKEKEEREEREREEREEREREEIAVAAAAQAFNLSAIDPSLGLDDDPAIPEEQAAAVAALVEGFISPHIKAENLE